MKVFLIIVRIIEIAALSAAGIFVLVKLHSFLRRYCISKLRYSRAFSNSKAYCGDRVKLVEKIYNPTIIPLLLIDVEGWIKKGLGIDGSNADASEPIQKSVSSFTVIMPFAEITREHDVSCVRRGRYTLESVSVTSSGKTRNINAPAELYVYPEPAESDTGEPPFNNSYGEYRVRRALIPDRFSVSGIRDYRSGDSFGMINFKATAKYGFSQNSIKVNAYDYSQSINCAVFLNFNISRKDSVDYAEYERLMEDGLSAAAGVIKNVTEQGGCVAFFCNCKTYNGGNFVAYPMMGGMLHMYDILGALAEMRIDDGYSFSALLDIYKRSGVQNTQFVIITREPDEATSESLNTIIACGNSVSIISLHENRYGRYA